MDSKSLLKLMPSRVLEYNFIKPKILLFHKNHDQKEIYDRLHLYLKILIKAIYVYHLSPRYEYCYLDLSFFNCKLSDLKEAVRE